MPKLHGCSDDREDARTDVYSRLGLSNQLCAWGAGAWKASLSCASLWRLRRAAVCAGNTAYECVRTTCLLRPKVYPGFLIRNWIPVCGAKEEKNFLKKGQKINRGEGCYWCFFVYFAGTFTLPQMHQMPGGAMQHVKRDTLWECVKDARHLS